MARAQSLPGANRQPRSCPVSHRSVLASRGEKKGGEKKRDFLDFEKAECPRFCSALPSAWPSVSVTGLRARGGFEVSITWRDGRLSECTIKSLLGHPVTVEYGDLRRRFETIKGEVIRLDENLETIN